MSSRVSGTCAMGPADSYDEWSTVEVYRWNRGAAELTGRIESGRWKDYRSGRRAPIGAA
jgi:hypothetical protein